MEMSKSALMHTIIIFSSPRRPRDGGVPPSREPRMCPLRQGGECPDREKLTFRAGFSFIHFRLVLALASSRVCRVSCVGFLARLFYVCLWLLPLRQPCFSLFPCTVIDYCFFDSVSLESSLRLHLLFGWFGTPKRPGNCNP